ncbi:MAG: M14 family zinc carboxypeptidase [Bacteroidales bacterium]
MYFRLLYIYSGVKKYLQNTGVIFLVLINASLHAGIPENIQKILDDRSEVYFKFLPEQSLNKISSMLYIDYFDQDTGYIYSYANESSFNAFLELDIEYELVTPPGLKYNKNSYNMLSSVDVENISSWDFYPTYEAYESMMQQFEDVFPDLFQYIEIETLPSGRKLIFGRITANVNEPNEKPKSMYTSTMHGNETTGFNILLRLIHYLLNNYGTDDEITDLLDNLEIWICPVENPDGTYRYDNSTVSGATRTNLNGIDLNRNYPNPVNNPDDDCQMETLAMVSLLNEHDFVLSANIHGGIELVNFPWDSWKSNQKLHADHNWWVFTMYEYVDTVRVNAPSDYMTGMGDGVTHGGDWYVVYGSRQDYANYYVSQREFTLEISNDYTLPTAQLPAHWDYNYRSLINYMKQSLYGIHGKVTDIVTGEPVRARIELAGHDFDNSRVFSSAEHGGFSRPVLAGTYNVEVHAPDYPVKIISGISVENYSTVFLDIELGTEVSVTDQSDFAETWVYPNPAADRLYLKNLTGIQKIQILDMGGRIIAEFTDASVSDIVDVSALHSGFYIIRFFIHGNVFNHKILKK